ncbi:S8 family serine peptidase [Alkalihalophilus pseudofirmus]|uniref:S8 family serine peptidase n=1 Tax=Alkalihalophilus pseudofirmus TaxID=79885 RepID=A0AAJ2U438_ALKPS|nr:S8 family serine peptidase [Alkalihalophilus pseudofirmus]MDV2886382.1 S8 family serine peptidase [Alkalihalophilus pseudofirmus]
MNTHMIRIVFILAFIFFITPYKGFADTQPYLITVEHPEDLEILEEYEYESLEAFTLFPGAVIHTSEEIYHLLQDHEDILSIEPDQSFTVETNSYQNWGLEHLSIPSSWASGYTGRGVKVAVIDSGINTSHPALKVAGGVSMVGYTTSYNDDEGHGTHSAGIIAAHSRNANVYGVAHGVELYAVKSLDRSGNGRLVDTIRGIEWAVDKGVDIINLSLGTTTPSTALKAAVDKAFENDVLVVAAAGNKKENFSVTKPVEYPAKYGSVIAVSAVDSRNRLAAFSASGPEIEFAAPGVSIYSTHLGSNYRNMNGTSMAAPFVTGVLALYKEANPDLSAREIRSLAQRSAKSLSSGRSEQFGYGLIHPPTKPKESQIKPPERLTGVVTERRADGRATVSLSWNKPEVNQALTYNIYRGSTMISSVSKESFTEALRPGTYSYQVTAVNESGIESVKSSPFSITVKEPTVEDSRVFKDVSPGFWAYPHINYLLEEGIISGYRDGTFQPNAPVRRGQAVAMLARALEWEHKPSATRFNDVDETYFASGAIEKAVEARIISGYPDGSFRPNAPITRAQMAAILGHAFQLGRSSENHYVDITERTTGYSHINRMTELKIVTGYDGRRYKPDESLSRAQFSVILSRILNEEFREL